MTVATKEDSGSMALRANPGLVVGQSWRRLWQVPLLLTGLLVFALGVRALVASIKPLPFETQAKDVRQLLALEKYDKAIAQINILADYYHKPQQQAELLLLAGDTHYLVQKTQPAAVPGSYQKIIDYYTRAVALGIVPTAIMNERWGEAAMVTGDAKVAVEKLEAAIEQEPSLVKPHARELVSAYAVAGQLEKAQAILNHLLADGDQDAVVEGGAGLEAIDNRTWALCKQIELAIAARAGAETLQPVVTRARAALKTIPERDPSGRILTWIGRAELEAGSIEQANHDLAEARQRFVAHHLDDGRAAVLLAKIAEAKEELEDAGELYKEVVRSQAGTPVWAAARFGRAEISARLDDPGEAHEGQEGGLPAETVADYRFAIDAVKAAPQDAAAGRATAELISREGVRTALTVDFQRAFEAGKLEQALTFLALQTELGEPETAATALRLATTQEQRADELVAEANHSDAKTGLETEAKARAMYFDAAEVYLRHSKMATMEDTASGNSLWKAAQLFDRAGMPLRSAAIYEQFTIQRPRDPRVPEGLLSIGRLYQSAGMLEKAIAAYQRNIKENPKTRASYASALNLARCYMIQLETISLAATTAPVAPGNAATTQEAGKGPAVAGGGTGVPAGKDFFDKAEAALLSLVQNNGDLEPSANEFRTSLFTLGELYYRNNRWADAILRLEEAVQRYPDDPGMARALFMLGESFRRSAGEIREAIAKDPAIPGRDALENARMERLARAQQFFKRVIALLDPDDAGAAGHPSIKLSPLQTEYVRASYMDQAECSFDRGDFANAIKLYDQAAIRFSEETLAVQAYVQIVNAYLALKEPTQASAAAERGRWILKRIPDEAFGRGSVPITRDYYEKLLALGRN